MRTSSSIHTPSFAGGSPQLGSAPSRVQRPFTPAAASPAQHRAAAQIHTRDLRPGGSGSTPAADTDTPVSTSPRHRQTRVTKRELGALGESIAARYLKSEGYTICERNWRCRNGEIDLIAIREGVCVAVEVKTRTQTHCGTPLEAITRTKSQRLRRAFAAWLCTQTTDFADIRIDAVGVQLFPDRSYTLVHLEGIS